MLDSIYRMTHFWRENVNILPSFTQRYKGRHNVFPKIVIYRFYCIALYHSQMRRHVIKTVLIDNFFL